MRLKHIYCAMKYIKIQKYAVRIYKKKKRILQMNNNEVHVL